MPRFSPCLPILLLALGSAGAARAEEDLPREAARLQQVERALEADRGRAESLRKEAAALAAEIAELRTELVAAAATAQDHEEDLSRLERALADLEHREAEKRAAFAHRQALLTDTLGALQRLSLQPREALLLDPESPIDTVRSAMLLRVAIPALKAQALALRQEMREIHGLGREIDRRRKERVAAAAALETERTRIVDLIGRKRALRRTTAEEQRATAARAAALAREAEDLRDLVTRLKTERKQTAMLVPPPSRPDAVPSSPAATMRLARPTEIRAFPTVRASLIPPVRGRLVTRFGENAGIGPNSKGITITTRGLAQVVAPFDGQVVFVGPFRGYGEILIIEHGGGYHSLLVGLGRTDAAVGQWLLAGEPVGIMGSAMDGNPELYLELRHDGEPIDPLPWLKSRDIEANARE